MIVTTQERVEHRTISQTLGVVSGQSIRARHVGKDILASFRNLVGGEITEYSKLMAESREQAMDRMKVHATELGADAIVGVVLQLLCYNKGLRNFYLWYCS
ncbi:MAG: hypothetical protein Ct9H300mP24_4640 [Candidatus Neomarinimicrobiota bacterium]|nr:MAG: hypothetical protein Ct9H300mP24_4640 [Candidatus Neomarinimicrobiota bacterium]